MRIENSSEGSKAIVLRLKIVYKVNGQEKSEIATVENLPSHF